MSTSATARSSPAVVGPWSASAATRVGDVLDLHVETGGMLRDPAEIRLGRRPAEAVVLEPGHGAVVEHQAVLVAPRRVDHLSRLELRRVARDHAIDEPHRVGPGEQVLVERRDVDQPGGVADGVVLVLVQRLVRARRVVARPLAVVETLAERRGSLVEGSPDGHERDYR